MSALQIDHKPPVIPLPKTDSIDLGFPTICQVFFLPMSSRFQASTLAEITTTSSSSGNNCWHRMTTDLSHPSPNYPLLERQMVEPGTRRKEQLRKVTLVQWFPTFFALGLPSWVHQPYCDSPPPRCGPEVMSLSRK